MSATVYDVPQVLNAMKLSCEVLSISSQKIRVREPNVSVKSTRKPVNSFCPNENRNNMTWAGSGMLRAAEARVRSTIGRKKPRFETFEEKSAAIRAKQVAKTVLLTARTAERK